jgi:hypothetical protein
MRTKLLGTITLLTTLTAAGCATSSEMAAWRGHDTHFASGAHALFSLRNDVSAQPKVSRADLNRADAETWWDGLVTVNQDQIVTR